MAKNDTAFFQFPQQFIWFGILIATLTQIACSEPSPHPIEPIETLYELQIQNVQFLAEIVVTQKEQQMGLMYRNELPQNQGMLFPYTRPQQMSFWMANTKIPLDIGFFDSQGILREIHRLYPNDRRSTRSSRSDLQFALEMNQGWFRSNGIKVGDKFDMNSLKNALAKRGFEFN